VRKNVSACDLPRQLKEKVLQDGIQWITVARNTLWEDTAALFKSKGFDPTPRVRFNDEKGIDAGGLRMEYFILLMKAVTNHPALLEGQENKRAITYNTSPLQSNLYFFAGRMIGCAIMYCDIGVPVFSKSMYYFISHATVHMTEIPHSAGHPRLLGCGTDTQGKAAHPDDDVGIFVDFVHNRIFLRHPRQD